MANLKIMNEKPWKTSEFTEEFFKSPRADKYKPGITKEKIMNGKPRKTVEY